MTEDALKSEAFHHATLKSESYRSIGLLCLLGALMIFALARGIATGERQLVVLQFVVLGSRHRSRSDDAASDQESASR